MPLLQYRTAQASPQKKMKRASIKKHTKSTVVVAATLLVVAVWTIANMSLHAQMPPRPTDRGTTQPPGGSDPLFAAWKQLPSRQANDTELTFLDDNDIAWAARWRLLESARERLDISYFILSEDIFGTAFLGHLYHKAQQGVEIRALLDAWGTKMSRDLRGNDYLDTLVNTEKVDVKMFRPMLSRLLDAFLTLDPIAIVASEHDKLLLADGKRGLTGGRNIATEYFADPKLAPEAFRDADVLLTGEQVEKAMVAAFDVQFNSSVAETVTRDVVDIHDSRQDLELTYQAMDAWLHGREIPDAVAKGMEERELPYLAELRKHPNLQGILKRSLPPSLTAPVRLLDSRTRLLEGDDEISNSMIMLARSAQESIFIQTPYLVLPKEAAAALSEAAQRGVRITILVNGPTSSKSATSQAVFLEQWPLLLAKAPGLRLFVAAERHSQHAKVITIDGRLTLVGTYNLDPLSMAINSELMVAVWSEAFVDRVLRKPRHMIDQGQPKVVRYRIKRDEQGKPVYDEEGAPVVAYGPLQHSDPSEWPEVERWGYVARSLIALPWIDPMF